MKIINCPQAEQAELILPYNEEVFLFHKFGYIKFFSKEKKCYSSFDGFPSRNNILWPFIYTQIGGINQHPTATGFQTDGFNGLFSLFGGTGSYNRKIFRMFDKSKSRNPPVHKYIPVHRHLGNYARIKHDKRTIQLNGAEYDFSLEGAKDLCFTEDGLTLWILAQDKLIQVDV